MINNWKVYIFLSIIIIIKIEYINCSCIGCVELDEITFDKLITKFEYSLIKFDIAFPYGDKHVAFSNFAKLVSPNVHNMLIGLVGVKDYGEKENSELAKRYNIDENKFPAILLYKNYSTDNWIQFPLNEEINVNNLKKFVKQYSNVYINLDGCIEVLDNLVQNFVIKSNEVQKEIIENVKKMTENLSSENDKEKYKVYIVIMERILQKGQNFIKEEQQRIHTLQNNKISDNKKKQLMNRLNVLESFMVKDNNELEKDEL